MTGVKISTRILYRRILHGHNNTHQWFRSLHTHTHDSKRKFLFCEIRRRRWIYNVFIYYTYNTLLLFFLCVYNIGWTSRILGVNCQLSAILDFMMPPLHTHKRIMYYARTVVLTGHLSYEFIFYFSAGSSSSVQRIPMEIISFSYLSDRCRT